ncbi:TolB-like translocation protein [Cesiribacter andamanensis]|uniref:WD40-like Beta Propeller Repeat protein n=1 Tax=Cesiribacter andamanensis AMV16 TaxID=1279009 RepID=M7NBV1_9BACT|nr:PD40 domain-containing protein [Cesiribacter andamanensis]EMR04666.1 WD40-like Beta Propeller Repeat protein [Cesiribacter andamanensis AMV16]
MKIERLIFGLAICLLGCGPSRAYLTFDQEPPELKPVPFAERLITKNGEHVGYCAFSPDGTELYYAVTSDSWFPSKMIRISANDLEKKDTLYLKDRTYEGEPFITRDGNTLYFTALLAPAAGEQWHADIYRSSKTADGWGTPELLDTLINSKSSEWHLSMTDRGVVYFASERGKGTSAWNGDLYRAVVEGNSFSGLEKLPYPVNTEYHESDPLIAPDESFLIFHSNRPGGYGLESGGVIHCDLYISFNENGKWTEPVNMGPDINSEGIEMAPALTPDGKYFLFTRRRAIETAEPAQIFWVSSKIFKRYR